MNIESLFDFKIITDGLDTSGLNDPLGRSENPLGLYVLDEHGEPVPEPDTLKWAEAYEETVKTGSRVLGNDTIGPYRVSTIFLAVDHGFGNVGPPVLWETMIFGTIEEMEVLGKRRRYRKTVDQTRYTSKAEALAGHAAAVKRAESLPRAVLSD